jgi:hypothetical protein
MEAFSHSFLDSESVTPRCRQTSNGQLGLYIKENSRYFIQDYCFLRCDAMQTNRNVSVWRNLVAELWSRIGLPCCRCGEGWHRQVPTSICDVTSSSALIIMVSTSLIGVKAAHFTSVEECRLLGYDAVWLLQDSTFWRNDPCNLDDRGDKFLRNVLS